jgi:integrase/recombinase XerD
MEALKLYLAEREKVGAPTVATAGLFWHQKGNRRYSYVTTHATLVKVLRRSGIKPAKGIVGPRIHDLRHAMVCNRILNWYKDGVNPQSRLAHLATFMGHRDINSTLVYLTVTPELLQLASSRFRERGMSALSIEEHQS